MHELDSNLFATKKYHEPYTGLVLDLREIFSGITLVTTTSAYIRMRAHSTYFRMLNGGNRFSRPYSWKRAINPTVGYSDIWYSMKLIERNNQGLTDMKLITLAARQLNMLVITRGSKSLSEQVEEDRIQDFHNRRIPLELREITQVSQISNSDEVMKGLLRLLVGN